MCPEVPCTLFALCGGAIPWKNRSSHLEKAPHGYMILSCKFTLAVCDVVESDSFDLYPRAIRCDADFCVADSNAAIAT